MKIKRRTCAKLGHKIFAVFLPFLFFGCAGANLIQSPVTSNSPYAPVNESARVGKISYRLKKNSSVNQESREIAYKKMHDACGGNYEIVSERESQKSYYEPGNTTYVGNVGYNDGGTYIKTYNNIVFRCVNKDKEKND